MGKSILSAEIQSAYSAIPRAFKVYCFNIKLAIVFPQVDFASHSAHNEGLTKYIYGTNSVKLDIPKSIFHKIVHMAMRYRNLSSRWVPKQLTGEHKFLQHYKEVDSHFGGHVALSDETQIYPVILETKILRPGSLYIVTSQQ